MSIFSRGLALTAALLLAGCAAQVRPPIAPPIVTATPTPTPLPAPPPPSPPATAREAGIALAAPQPVEPARAARALAAFRTSCPALLTRTDASGLTQAGDWQAPCAEAATVVPGSESGFFHDRFDWVSVGPGAAFATGYYEPEIAGSRVRAAGYDTPLYAAPTDLIRCAGADGKVGRGRLDESGQCTLYFTRAEIDDGALANRQLEIAWAADPVELFFLEVQGSGRLRQPDGSVMRVGYASQNGRDYVAIGRLLRERGLLPPGGATMTTIVAWIRAHPDEGRALMRENPSYVFFKELTGPGPLGALGVAVTPQASVAADPKFVPLGAPIFLDVDRAEADGLWVAQDTGGAIKGANRFDTFWGAGASAEAVAGGMSASGRGWILLPKGVAARAQPLR